MAGKRYKDGFRRSVMSAVLDGMSVKSAAEKFGAPEPTIYKWMSATRPSRARAKARKRAASSNDARVDFVLPPATLTASEIRLLLVYLLRRVAGA